MDKMKWIVICQHCGEAEYYGEMRWLSGIYFCRNCYKGQCEHERHEIYRWDDLDGKRPTMEEYFEQERKGMEVRENAKLLQRAIENPGKV